MCVHTCLCAPTSLCRGLGSKGIKSVLAVPGVPACPVAVYARPMLMTPSLSDCLLCRELGAKGTKSMLAVPVSFVSEHIETLEEIDMGELIAVLQLAAFGAAFTGAFAVACMRDCICSCSWLQLVLPLP